MLKVQIKVDYITFNKWEDITGCFGLTQDPSNGNYMLNAIHRNLHSEICCIYNLVIIPECCRAHVRNFIWTTSFINYEHAMNIINCIGPKIPLEYKNELTLQSNVNSNGLEMNKTNMNYISSRFFTIDDFAKSHNQRIILHQRSSNIFKANSKKYLKGIQEMANKIYNNPNLHSEKQDELEIPDGEDN
ncbi:hypothetical protein RhiirA1_452457 [Rhizophagus irregularis]|uniref:Uncharacterized protein n=1 Tax=Rhizophagus irregularis TaxID=588596 RepID=A0A2I1EW37_9GLOM|nr:hypothetical protein RhiirA1_452457 [Rhizophagus irregularis]PKY26341.1 hypothetical protein RhiirB3_441605 [Rhizophagus irregularis]